MNVWGNCGGSWIDGCLGPAYREFKGPKEHLILTRTSRSRRYSWGCSTSWTQSSSGGPQVREAAKWPREDSLPKWSGFQRQCSQLRGRSRSRWCQSPSPKHWRQSSSSSPSPQGLVIPASGCVSSWETWSYRTGPRGPEVGYSKVRSHPVKESPKKQVQFDLNEELGGKPTMSTGMTLFLSEGEAIKQHTAPISTKTGPVDALWSDHEEGPQQSFTPTRGTRPIVWSSTSQPQLKPETRSGELPL